MRIKLTRRKGSASIAFKAETHQEGRDLAEAVVAIGNNVGKPGGVERLIDTLGEKGYKGVLVKETKTVREFAATRLESEFAQKR